MVGETLEGYPQPVTKFSICIDITEKLDESRSYAFDLRCVDDPTWMISIKRGKSLTLFIDGEKVEFVTLSDPWRTSGADGMNGGASYSTTPEIIRKISEAKSVKVKIKASKDIDLSFTEFGIRDFKRFYDKVVLNPSGLSPKELAGDYYKWGATPPDSKRSTCGVEILKNCRCGTGYTLTGDNADGSIVAFEKLAVEAAENVDIYAQRIDGSCNALWKREGVAVCERAGNQYDPQLLSDGVGGAIAAWVDYDSACIYVQRFDGNGSPLWAMGGTRVCAVRSSEYGPLLISDGAGGAIVSWSDFREGFVGVFCQRIDAKGNLLWKKDAIGIGAHLGSEQICRGVVPDNSGNAIFVWYDVHRTGYDKIFAQKVGSNGRILWGPLGICGPFAEWDELQIARDGNGGVIVTWKDQRQAYEGDIYAQRVDGGGNVAWGKEGIPICTASGRQGNPQIVCDGTGSAIIVWEDDRENENRTNIYAQGINTSGTAIMSERDGIAIQTGVRGGSHPQIIADSSSGALVVVSDRASKEYNQIQVYKIDAGGRVLWKTDKLEIASVPKAISDNRKGIILTWEEIRDGICNMYAQRIDSNGNIEQRE
jgi:hypothetical protein